MRKYSRLQKQADFGVPLLEVVADMPGHQGQAGMVVDEVIRRYDQFITEDALGTLPSGGQRCSKHIRWQAYVLRRGGLMDSPRPGLWHITSKGLDWLRDNPDSTTMDLRWRQRKCEVRKPPRTTPPESAAEHDRWLAIIKAEVRGAREFLRGRATRPSDERLCDLVQLCYMLELYPEAQGLFALIDPSAVNAWLYRRTSRLATICARKSEV